MSTDTEAGLILLALVIVINFIPSFIGFSRGVKHPWLLLLGNFLFGWTVGGWFVALVYAVTTVVPQRPQRPVPRHAYYDTHDFFPRRREPRI
jgi:RsiW-degrading membrane proteinase PrsW (M82 family)